MRTKFAACLAMSAGLASSAFGAAGDVVISQAYVGGGFAISGTLPESLYQNDFIELHNRTNAAVDISGWSIQYASTAGTSWTNKITIPAATSIPAGGYYLVRANDNTFACTSCVPVPFDLGGAGGVGNPGELDASSSNGKLALMTISTTITSGISNPITDPTFGPSVMDFLGYGTANASEGGSASPGPTTTNPAGVNSIMRGPSGGANPFSGCQDSNVNASDFAMQPTAPRNSSTAAFVCPSVIDCDNNGIDDAIQIAGNPSLDCNVNGALDSCEIASNPAVDCDGNSQIDSCQIAANPSLDCNVNSKLDSCDIAADVDLDGGAFGCGAPNGTLDQCETPGPGEDCNGNGDKDCWDFKTWLLTDVDNNGIYDVCEGAIVVECAVNGTVQNGGVRAGDAGNTGFNIEGLAAGGTSFESYGALRWSNADFGAPASVGRVYFYAVQWNAGFTSGGIPGLDPDNLEVFHTNADAVDIAPGAATSHANRNVDFPDMQSATTYMFEESTITPADLPGRGTAAGSGDVDATLLYDASGSPSAGASAIAAEIVSGSGDLTLIVDIANSQEAAAATYAGRTHALYRGPTLVIFPGTGPVCDGVDFNQDGLFPDTLDIDDFISVFGGGPCSNDPNCSSDIDFNNDGLFPDTLDIDAFISVFGGGPCIV